MSTMRALVVATSWLGDLVMAGALTARLAEQGAEVTMLASRALAPLAERLHGVSGVLIHDLNRGSLELRERWRLGERLRRERFASAYVLPNTFKAALAPAFARIPRRVGWLGEQRRGVLNDWRRLDKLRYPRMVERFVALAEPAGSPLPEPLPTPALVVADDARSWRESLGVDPGRPLLVLAPGAAFGPAKRWPVAHFRSLADRALAAGWQVVLVGGPAEQPLARELMDGQAAGELLDTVGTLTLDRVVDLLAGADRVVANDSGLLHVAAALDRPTVALYGSSSPDFTPPLSAAATVLKLDLPCAPCFQRVCPFGHTRCLTELSPERVWSALTSPEPELPSSAAGG